MGSFARRQLGSDDNTDFFARAKAGNRQTPEDMS
jgi:hypothetical protein